MPAVRVAIAEAKQVVGGAHVRTTIGANACVGTDKVVAPPSEAHSRHGLGRIAVTTKVHVTASHGVQEGHVDGSMQHRLEARQMV